jgi:hypothetical protein
MAHQLNTGYNDFRGFIIDTCKEFDSKFDFNNAINRIELEGFKDLTIPEIDEDSKKSTYEGQLIVIENSRNLPILDYNDINYIEFTKSHSYGRYGFLNGVDVEQ